MVLWAFRLEDSPSGHSLQVLAEAAPGFPLLSLTRNAGMGVIVDKSVDFELGLI
jgi:hypothetical protein